MQNLGSKINEKLDSENHNFEQLINELSELQEWNEKSSVTEQEISELLDTKKHKKHSILAIIVRRLKKETDIEMRLEGMIDLSAIIDIQKFIDDSYFIYETEFEEDCRKAQYYGGFIVLAKAEYDRSIKALQDLASGFLPDDFVSIFHEKIHRTQRGLRRWIKTPDENKLILEDVHAYKGENEIYPFGSSVRNYIERILQDPAIGNHLSIDEIRERVIVACDQVERLIAQGINHKSIGKMIQKTHWDAQKICFKNLNTVNISQEDQEKQKDRNRLRRKITLLKIKKIAQEEIKTS